MAQAWLKGPYSIERRQVLSKFRTLAACLRRETRRVSGKSEVFVSSLSQCEQVLSHGVQAWYYFAHCFVEAFACGCVIFELLGAVERETERERLRRCVLSGVVFAFLRIEKAPLLRTRVSFTLAWLGLNGIAVEALHRLCTFGCVLSAAEFELRASMCV